ncbi:hypothetical protein LP420_14900 [Massilia sp. B-10]|nr:hypothetical protein LP420_14900 [Massilia sp. B-10]
MRWWRRHADTNPNAHSDTNSHANADSYPNADADANANANADTNADTNTNARSPVPRLHLQLANDASVHFAERFHLRRTAAPTPTPGSRRRWTTWSA